MYLNKRGLKTYCFSPPVMIATASIELVLMFYTLWKYKRTKIGQIAAVLLFFLAAFQMAEYNVCGGLGLHAETWSRIGFMVIATLPPLGIHLAMVIAKKDIKLLRYLAYATALVFILLFGFTERIFSNHTCGGNYIIFHVNHQVGVYYFIHYYFWLLAGIILNLRLMKQVKQRQRESLGMLVIGYLVFIIPTTLLNSFKPETTSGIPSILCGFAVLFAFILVFGILPNELDHKTNKLRS